ncbi:hypothetical protein [Leptospira adleri]|uniref:Uncharacterized protein n=1 Tax=Leptospira adleri TaxID=2023186 RepID=A0A2M9YTS9_9LEPT|nr:hypothetical protein [Leptospira adleri]PJZ54938.1 hypothetical protein CH380_03755 [Leptospira adleri]PJZ62001.1 hypothetical protein CH376_10595 [Leptospira adleri]TGM57898.1 hypothetical protein EHQ97_09455 [Leptospira adleri]
MKTIRLTEDSPELFLKKMRKALSGKELGSIVSFHLEDQKLTIRFAGFGESKIWYSIRKSEDGFEAIKLKEKISFTHLAFRSGIESELRSLMERFGAEISDE